ncbi:MAG TPA: DUF1559 domain-containing protein [Gemmataceae bacterium]|nr:DUF1559 domain-containing protein [Gemmataceae bacterium]
MRRRAGWSRAEVLVVLALAVLVAGLIVGTIGRIRAEADGVKCRNNLKQLGLGVHSYYSTLNRLPPLTDQGDRTPTGQGLLSVLANLVPYIEAGPNYFSPGVSPPGDYQAHSSVVFTYHGKFGDRTWTEDGGLANRSWRVFVDPADDTADKLRDVPMTLPDGTIGYYATGSYAANGLAPWGVRQPGRAFPGGLTNTILIGERPQVCRTASGEEVYNLWGLGIYSPQMPAFAALTPTDPPGLLSTGQVAPVEPLPDETAEIRVRIGRRDAEPGPPDFGHPIQRTRGGRPCDPRLPGTPHRGGMQVLMADASVRVFGPDTSPWVFWSACVPGTE